MNYFDLLLLKMTLVNV